MASSQIAGMNGNLFSATAECTQAVNAADWAKGVKQSDSTSTLIYSISYGSETSGCTSGESVPAIGGNPANHPLPDHGGYRLPAVVPVFLFGSPDGKWK